VKMKELWISRYGPISYSQPVRFSNFTLFYGKNEDGKTLTIDALIKLLLGKKGKVFTTIDRVQEMPEGYLVLEEEDGSEIKLDKNTTPALSTRLSPKEWKNVFIIRNSDLGIPSEGEFYTSVADRLTGLQMEKIENVKNTVLEMALLTPGGKFRDKEGEKIKSRVENAGQCREKIQSLLPELRREDCDGMLEAGVDLREKIEAQNREIESLENARRREMFEKGVFALQSLEKSEKDLSSLEQFSEEEQRLWEDAKRNIGEYKKQVERLHTALRENEEALKDIRHRIEEGEDFIEGMTARKNTLDEEIRPRLRRCKEKIAAVAGERAKSTFYSVVLGVSAAFAGASLTGYFFRPELLYLYPLGMFGVLFFLMVIFKLKLLSKKAWLRRSISSMSAELSKYGMSGGTFEAIQKTLQIFTEEFKRRAKALESDRVEQGIAEREIGRIQNERIPDLEEKIKDADRTIEAVQTKAGVASCKEYANRIKEKHKGVKSVHEHESVLFSLFGGGNTGPDPLRDFWRERVEELSGFKNASKETVYDENALSERKAEKKQYEDQLHDLEGKLENFRESLGEVETSVNSVLQLNDDYQHCKTTMDLSAADERLERFIREHEERKNDALTLLDILGEVENEKRETVSQLFAKESSVSRYFSHITEKRYREVQFNAETLHIEVVSSDGRTLSVEKLSAGTFDQLYLAVRISLGESLLGKAGGFFIMDDPFIRSDSTRLKAQISTLKKIAALGWQILYFSAKREVEEYLKRDIEKQEVALVSLPGT
jgi:exonuclease SbcC